MKKLMDMYHDFRDRVLIIYIVLSILFCVYYSAVFLLIGAVLPAGYQTVGMFLMLVSLLLIYKEKISIARYLSVGTSYGLVFGQSFIFFGGDSGFQFSLYCIVGSSVFHI